MSFLTWFERAVRVSSRAALLPFLAWGASAQTPGAVTQAPVWAGKPDIAAFEKMENERLAAGQRSIDQILAVAGPRTVENTLVPYDEILRQYNSAGYLSALLQQVHPDAAFRDAATAMTSKVGNASACLLYTSPSPRDS